MTFLADTSAWIEYLRETGSDADLSIRDAITGGDPPAWTPPVLLEVEIGRTDEHAAADLRRLVTTGPALPMEDLVDWRSAARLHRAARRGGRTVRSVVDCLVAAVAIRADLPVLHRDRDFDVLAEVGPLRLATR